MATALARQVGVSRASQALHLDYYSLQRRLSGGSPEPESAASPDCTGGFVELSLPQPSRGLRCALEACDGAGGTMRAELSGLTAEELSTVLRAMMDKTPCCR